MRLGTVLRTVRHVEPAQAAAQLRHLLFHRGVVPVRWRGPPPRLRVATAAAPFPGAPDHARCGSFGAGLEDDRHVELIGRRIDFGERIDWESSAGGPLWSYHLHGFDFARRPGLHPDVRTMLLLDWIARHPRGVGWDPHPTSNRILAWGKLLLTPGALSLERDWEPAVLASLAGQVETLSRHLEVRLQGNHLFTNLVAVVFGGLLLEGGAERWLGLAPRLLREIDKQVPPDGMHVEGSPMYHSLLLENVLDLLNLARVAGRAAPDPLVAGLEATASRMLGALQTVVHPDGEIALLGDSAFGIAQAPGVLAEYAGLLGIEAAPGGGWLEHAGIARLEAGPCTSIARLAGPAPPYQPGHAHCDALSFELSWHGRRIVTDTGVCEYVPGPRRDRARATLAHAIVRLDGIEQAECWSAHRVGGRPSVEVAAVEPGRLAEARCRPWAARDAWHARRFELEGDVLRVHDRLEGAVRHVEVSLPLAPGLEAALEGGELRVRDPHGPRLRVGLPEGPRWRLETAASYPRFGMEVERPCLVGEGEALSGSWTFRSA